MKEDMIAMTVREQRRAQILTRVLEGAITLREAAQVMGLSLRQARRLKSELRRLGPGGLVHGNRGQPSPRRIDPETRAKVVTLYRGRYAGANGQHFTELLAEREGIDLSVATVRRTLKAAGVKTPSTRRAPKHRSRRERMPAEGMLLQIDASPFRWLGPTGPKWSLVGAIDDATGDPVAALFREQEDAAGYMELLRQVVRSRGIPEAVYRDRHMIFEVTKRLRTTIEEDFAGAAFPTQVGRLLAELGVESIAAYSPQAKGRVERSWRTQQDRLVTELRLAEVRTLEEANAFLPSYLERYRARFAVPARSQESAYVPMDPETNLDRLFCFKYQRAVANDHTIRFAGRVIELPRTAERVSYARARVEVHERLDGSLAVWLRGTQLVCLPPPAEPPTLRSRKSDRPAAKPQPAGSAPTPKPLSWNEVRRRARTASTSPMNFEAGKPTGQHPWVRQKELAIELRKQHPPQPTTDPTT
jgi:transposase